MCVFDNKKNCAILTDKTCDGCKWARTEEQAADRLAKKYARFRTFSQAKQQLIADKYYEGVMAWEE